MINKKNWIIAALMIAFMLVGTVSVFAHNRPGHGISWSLNGYYLYISNNYNRPVLVDFRLPPLPDARGILVNGGETIRRYSPGVDPENIRMIAARWGRR